MIPHVAAVALLNEAKVLAHPASVDNLPTSGGKEDHVSMGMTAALKLRTIVENAEHLFAIELLAAARRAGISATTQKRRWGRAGLEPLPHNRAALEEDRVWPAISSEWRSDSRRRFSSKMNARSRPQRPRNCILSQALITSRQRIMTRKRMIRAPRGNEMSCKGWHQEAALRMLMNNLDPEVAENPDKLIVYGGTGRAARSWEAFDAIVRSLRESGE